MSARFCLCNPIIQRPSNVCVVLEAGRASHAVCLRFFDSYVRYDDIQYNLDLEDFEIDTFDLS